MLTGAGLVPRPLGAPRGGDLVKPCLLSPQGPSHSFHGQKPSSQGSGAPAAWQLSASLSAECFQGTEEPATRGLGHVPCAPRPLRFRRNDRVAPVQASGGCHRADSSAFLGCAPSPQTPTPGCPGAPGHSPSHSPGLHGGLAGGQTGLRPRCSRTPESRLDQSLLVGGSQGFRAPPGLWLF